MSLKRLGIILDADPRGLQTGLARSGASVRTFAAEVGAASGSILTRTAVMQAGVLAAAVGAAAALKQTVGAAVSFEVEMRNVNSIMKLTEDGFTDMTARVLDLATRVPQSADTLAKGLYDIASSGFQGAEGLEILEQAAMAATAGMTDTATAAKAITAVLNAYGLQASDAADVSDILFQTVNLGVLTFEELGAQVGEVVGIAAAATVEIDEATASLAAMTVSGLNAAEAGTSLQRVLQGIIDPTDAMAAALRSMGYESGAAALEVRTLPELLEELRVATGGNVETLQVLFGDIRGLRGAFAAMANDGKNLARTTLEIADASKRAGSTQDAFAEQMKATGNELKLTANDAKAWATELGTHALPVVGAVADGLGDLLGVLRPMSGFLVDHQEIVVAVGIAYALKFAPAVMFAAKALLDIPLNKASLGLANLTTTVSSLSGALRLLGRVGLVGAIAGLIELVQWMDRVDTEARELAATNSRGLILSPDEKERITQALDETYAKLKLTREERDKLAQAPENIDLTSGIDEAVDYLEVRIAAIQERPEGLWSKVFAAKNAKETAETFREMIQVLEAEDIALRAVNDDFDVHARNGVNVAKVLQDLGLAAGDVDSSMTTLHRDFDAFTPVQEGILRGYRDQVKAARDAGASTDELAGAIHSLLTRNDPQPLLDLASGMNVASGAAGELAQITEETIEQLKRVDEAAQEAAGSFVNAFGLINGLELKDPKEAAEEAARALDKVRDAEERLTDAQSKVTEDSRHLVRTPERDRDLAKAKREVAEAERDLARARDEATEAAERQRSPEEAIAEHARQQVEDARDFIDDIGKLADKVDPRFLAKALADPEAYDQIIDTLADDANGALVKQINETERKMADLQNRIYLMALQINDGVAQGMSTLGDEMLSAMEYALNASAGEAQEAAYLQGVRLAEAMNAGFGSTLVVSGGGVADLALLNSAEPRARGAVDAHIATSETVLYGERSTGGEAYIPLGPAHRQRSSALLSDVAHRFGLGLIPMARGGMIGGATHNYATGPQHTKSNVYKFGDIHAADLTGVLRQAEQKTRLGKLAGV
jgi:TP901 family phage tail tape measure protein